MIRLKNILTILLLSVTINATAQNPVPAGDITKRVLLFGGTAHIGNGKVIEQSAIGLKDGKIIFVMPSKGYKPDLSSFDTVIYLEGKHVYPGFIAMGTQLGISEVEAIRSTNDMRETGKINPGARAIIAYNTDSKVTPTVRANGVLTAQIAPQGGLLSGTSSVVSLDAWNWEDAAYKTDDGVWMNWPSMRIAKAWWADAPEEQQLRYEKSIRELTQFFADAKAYSTLSNPEIRNAHLEAMREIFSGNRKLYVDCNFERDIIAAVNFCKQYGIKMVLTGGKESGRVADFLAANKIPVLIMRTHALPAREDDDVYAMYKLPAILKNAGVEFAITDEGFWQMRNLPFEAGITAGFGLTKEDALTAITLAPARIMGIDKTLGTLEDEKDATLFISGGDALDMKTNKVEMAFIKGREINLDNVQLQLYKKYMKKYSLAE